MFDKGLTMPDPTISRRELFRRGRVLGGLLALPSLSPRAWAGPAWEQAERGAVGALEPGAEVYQSIGVRPLINARGTFTILSGSLMLPEVRAAIDAASRHYVHLDELNDAIGARLAQLTGAGWGMVTSGCAAALTHATAACVAGGNPDLHIRIPHLAGFAKDEVIIPKHSRNVYDAAVRAVGVHVIEVATPEELEAALGPRTAMIYLFAGPRADASPLSLQAIAPAAEARQVPIVVDAAAEILTVPNVHLERGATLVGYSGGKCLRGPQAAGLLLGREDLVRAAWVHSAPHHGFARSMKVGKEEAIGMLMAVEMWVRRDHDAEWAEWTGWLDEIADRVNAIEGVRTTVDQPRGLSNRTPSLRVLWDGGRLGVSGAAVVEALFETQPRVALSARRDDPDTGETGVSINPYMLSPGDATVVADRLHAQLANPVRQAPAPPAAPAADLTGEWTAEIAFAAGRSIHALYLHQQGGTITGSHQGDFVTRDLRGSLEGTALRLRSARGEEYGDALTFTFSGTVVDDRISGSLDMGEYLGATWTATRRVA
jgi:L-seryl-tRNA(Ser) seleniumtransferase